ncbi:RNA polymerase sigma factor RpoH [Bartonella ancashensis]|uniref:RNA polymerase sigma factor RpoH n=1 Tax=Bartonella ancashensis TaxID=1318743 RepID=A0A0M4L711_9HYPH|nr:RNA polymerase sigma factor RpoH [Bartonella ancashensis]ALE02838.1 RNA polymerase sigma factor RpoH [Bartonella ancashensis]
MAYVSLPSMTAGDGGISRYLEEIRRFPMLKPKEEYMLAKRYQKYNDLKAAHRLVTSHLRLVAKIAIGYRGYGLPIGEVISEGNIGLMQAVKRFEPERGFRLATYAMWWIKASIQEYVLRSWSLVKVGTTSNQKRLFFNLRKLKSKLQAFDNSDLNAEQVKKIATKLNVTEDEVVSMNHRLSGDVSLNTPLRTGDDERGEWQNLLIDDANSQEQVLIEQDEHNKRRSVLMSAMNILNERERRIFQARRLSDPTLTLEDLSAEFNISRERVRQIEMRAFEKVQNFIKASFLSTPKLRHAKLHHEGANAHI